MTTEESPPKRGRPRVRFAERDEQVRQNMRLYRARRTAELDALARALDRLTTAVATGDAENTFRAAALVAGVWAGSAMKESRARTSAGRTRRSPAAREDAGDS